MKASRCSAAGAAGARGDERTTRSVAPWKAAEVEEIELKHGKEKVGNGTQYNVGSQ